MAAKPVIQIDGKNFVAVPQGPSGRVVRRLRNEDFISQFSGEGIRSPSTFQGYETLIFPNFSLGLGRERIDSDSARVTGEYRRFWDATCDTRFASGIYLPILEEDSTSTGLEVVRASASFKGNLWSLWEGKSGHSLVARKYNGGSTAWDGGGTLLDYEWAYNATTTGAVASSRTLTFAHTPAGNDRALVVLIQSGGPSAGTNPNRPTGVTFDGNAMSFAGEAAATSKVSVTMWTLQGSGVTASEQNVVATFNAAYAVRDDITGAAISFKGASPTFGTAATANAQSGTPSVAVGSAAGDIVVDGVAVDHSTVGGVTATVGSDQTERQNAASSGGDLVRSLASTETAGGTSTTMSWTLSASNRFWGSIGAAVKEGATFMVPLDILAVRTNLLALFAFLDGIHVYRSTDGVTWAASTTDELGSSVLADNVGVHEDIDAGLLSEIGGEAVAAIWDEDNSKIIFYTSTDAGDNWSLESNIDISSGNGPQGVAVLAGIDNEDKLYVGTREGIYEVDTAPSTWTTRLIFPMTGHNDNCRRMGVMHDGALWFAQGVDDDTPPIVYRMFVSNGARVIERVPNDFSLGDGLTSDALGPIRWMISADGMVYASSGGVDVADSPTARHARIWCHNGKGWHSVRKHATNNQKIEWIAASSDDDGKPRLHYAVRTGTAAHDVNFLGQPFVNPASGVTIKRESTGIVDLPYVDLSFPLDIKNWLRVGVNADTLSSGTTDQHIKMYYGITSDLGTLAARNASELGDITSSTRRLPFKTLTLEVGAAGLVLGLRANMLLGSATNTVKPVLKDIQIDGLPKPEKTRWYEVILHIADTAALRGAENATAEVYTDLDIIEDLKVKAVLTYADIGTKNLDVRAVNYDDKIIGHSATGGPDSNARRAGTAQIILSEVAA